jgi:adenylate cyclase
MPEEARIAAPLLERALALEPEYALAHGYLAWCNEILFMRGGFDPEVAAAAVRHGRAAIAYGSDDAMALALGAFALGMVGHDRPTAIDAFEAALALSPSCSPALMFGSVSMGWANEPERAIEWGDRAVQLSPFDRHTYGAHIGRSVGYFALGRYEEAANAGRNAIRANPGLSVEYTVLVAALAALGRLPEARVAAAQNLALNPAFTTDFVNRAVAVPEALATPFIAALQAAGLP